MSFKTVSCAHQLRNSGPTMASPVYSTMVVLAGVSLIGVHVKPIAQPESRAATASPTSAF